MYYAEKSEKSEKHLLATHVSDNKDFEGACLSGNSRQIMSIVESEMEKHNLFTKGSKKLRADILRMLGDKDKVSYHTGSNVLSFVWNARLSGVGLKVIK
jgi:hypothetical protein